MTEIIKIVPADDVITMLKNVINNDLSGFDTVDNIQIDHYAIAGDGKTIVIGDGVCRHSDGSDTWDFEFDFEINAGTSSSAPVILGDLEVVIQYD